MQGTLKYLYYADITESEKTRAGKKTVFKLGLIGILV
jgi:hypothetical protein